MDITVDFITITDITMDTITTDIIMDIITIGVFTFLGNIGIIGDVEKAAVDAVDYWSWQASLCLLLSLCSLSGHTGFEATAQYTRQEPPTYGAAPLCTTAVHYCTVFLPPAIWNPFPLATPAIPYPMTMMVPMLPALMSIIIIPVRVLRSIISVKATRDAC
jgi:hypothetical protein